MHQHPRPAPRAASAASNQVTNPERTNNPRDRPVHRTRSSQDLPSYAERTGGDTGAEQPRVESSAAAGHDRETTKLNQIVQHFHSKAALMICSARANLPQVYTKSGDPKQNRWFNIVLDDTDMLLDDLQEWKRPDLSEVRPPPLIIETFLDTTALSQNQALVIVDDSGKRWDVSDAVASSADSSPRPSRNASKHCEVVLERWTVELGDPAGYSAAELNDQLPNVYKKGVVLFRSLYTFLRFLPAWKLHRRLARQPGNHQSLKLKFRIRQGPSVANSSKDSLYTPLCPSELSSSSNIDQTAQTSQHVEHHRFPSLRCPAGPLSIRVDYRHNQDFAVADAESLLSSRFLGIDEGLPTLQTGRSLPGARTQHPRPAQRTQHTSYGSAADTRRTVPRGLLGAYGSLGAYNTTDTRSSQSSNQSPRVIDDRSSDSMDRVNELNPRYGKQTEQQRISTSLRSGKSPFKAGSLEASPRDRPPSAPLSITPPKQTPTYATSHGKHDHDESERSFLEKISDQKGEVQSAGRPDYDRKKRNSSNYFPQQALRASSIQNETAIASSGSSSPRPAPISKYSSSFNNRPPRIPHGSARSGESGGSSGRGSSTGAVPDTSLRGSGAAAADSDEKIADFVAMLEAPAVKNLVLSRPSSQGGHSVNLAKYTKLGDQNEALAQEMSASSLIQASSTPPSRRLSNVPGLSTSSSPSRALAHAPHVRSRLSTHSIAEERAGSGSPKVEEEEEDEDEPFIFPMA